MTATRPVTLGLLPHLRRARDHIDRHYEAALDLDELATVAGVSKFHFVRSFEATYGETPMRLLTRRRIECAQDLLRGANLTVTEVCRAGRVRQPRIVLVAVLPAGRREPHRLPRPLGGTGRRARPRLLPLHARRSGPGRHHRTRRPGAGSRNLREARAGLRGLGFTA